MKITMSFLAKRAVFTIAALLAVCNVYAQKSDRFKPAWIDNKPETTSKSYHFEDVTTDAGKDLQSARVQAVRDLVKQMGGTSIVSVSEGLQDSSTSYYTNGSATYEGAETYSIQIDIEDQDKVVHYQVIDEYYEIDKTSYGERFRLHTLFAVSDSPRPHFEEFNVSKKYGIDAGWRSMVLPGLGQFYKGDSLKGGLMLGGTVAFVGGIIYTECMRTAYLTKASQTHDLNAIKTYNNYSTAFGTARNICIAGTAALYLYNIIDAFVADGARRIIISNKGGRERVLTAKPAVVPGYYAGVMASINF